MRYTFFVKPEWKDFSQAPEALLEEEANCLWLWVGARRSAEPLKSLTMQWVDWSLVGALSRWLKSEKTKAATTFIPTRGKITAPLLAIECGKTLDWSLFLRNCEGMKLDRVVLLCEGADQIESAKKALPKQKLGEYPKSMLIAYDVGIRPPVKDAR